MAGIRFGGERRARAYVIVYPLLPLCSRAELTDQGAESASNGSLVDCCDAMRHERPRARRRSINHYV
jgi:hypothetical protein